MSCKKFDSEKDENRYPSLSHCSLTLFNQQKHKKGRIKESLHSYSVRQKYWDKEMLKIDYDAVTIDIQDYIIDICMVTTDLL